MPGVAQLGGGGHAVFVNIYIYFITLNSSSPETVYKHSIDTMKSMLGNKQNINVIY